MRSLSLFFAFQDEYNAATSSAEQASSTQVQLLKAQGDIESLQSTINILQARLPQIYTANQNVKNSAVASDLANFVMTGTEICNTFADKDDAVLIKEQYTKWDYTVRLYLETNLGPSYLAPYVSATGGAEMLMYHSIDGDGWYALLQSKMNVLNGYIAKFQPSRDSRFNPSKSRANNQRHVESQQLLQSAGRPNADERPGICDDKGTPIQVGIVLSMDGTPVDRISKVYRLEIRNQSAHCGCSIRCAD